MILSRRLIDGSVFACSHGKLIAPSRDEEEVKQKKCFISYCRYVSYNMIMIITYFLKSTCLNTCGSFSISNPSVEFLSFNLFITPSKNSNCGSQPSFPPIVSNFRSHHPFQNFFRSCLEGRLDGSECGSKDPIRIEFGKPLPSPM